MHGSRIAAGAAVVTAVIVGGIGGAVLGVPSLSGAEQFSAATAGASCATPIADRAGFRLRGGAEFEAAAKALNLTPEELREKLSNGTTTIADVAKEQNVDIDTVIDAMVEADREQITDIVDNPWPAGGKDRMHPGGPGFKFGPGLGRGIGGSLDAISDALNMTPEELREAFSSGKTIGEIAKEKNVDVDGLIDTLVKEATEHIDELEQSGKISSEQADKLKADLKERITTLVNEGMKIRLPKLPREWMDPGND
jgi:hypothetical protein